MLYLRHRKGTTAHKGLTSKVNWKFIESPPCLGQSSGWFFYALKHYLINVKTNVSNAKMNIPKAIKSLKSKGFLSISTTPILCKNRGQPPCNTVVSYGIILPCFNTADNSYNCHIAKKKSNSKDFLNYCFFN